MTSLAGHRSSSAVHSNRCTQRSVTNERVIERASMINGDISRSAQCVRRFTRQAHNHTASSSFRRLFRETEAMCLQCLRPSASDKHYHSRPLHSIQDL